jgi:hypothetical protein
MRCQYRIAVSAVIAWMAGCTGPPPPEVDIQSRNRDVWGLRPGDIEQCAQKMARDLVGEPLLNRSDPPVRVGIAGIENHTNEPFVGDSADMIAQRIQTILFRSLQGEQRGSGGTAKFISMRDAVSREIFAQRRDKRRGNRTHRGLKDLHGVDYILTGVYHSVDKVTARKRLVDMILTFTLVDAESEEIVWTYDCDVQTVTRG